jgi:predicted RNA-binding Zn-ribbon protein involved in translation (DUF1610 family)
MCEEVISMPELRCPECGKVLLPTSAAGAGDYCVCTACGRQVYTREQVKVKVACPKCGKENETTVAR